MKTHLSAFTLAFLSVITNLSSYLLTTQPGTTARNGALAMVSTVMLALLFVLHDFLPTSHWTRANALRFGAYCIGLELFMLCMDRVLGHDVNVGSSTGVALFLAMILLFRLNSSQPATSHRNQLC